MLTAFLCALGMSYAGFVALSLSMNRHQDQMLGRRLPSGVQHGLRAAGWGLLALSTWPCMAHWGGSIGLLGVWGGIATLSAFALAFTLPYAPKAALRLCVLAPLPVMVWLAF